MLKMFAAAAFSAALFLMPTTADAGREDFHHGTAIPEYGLIADVEGVSLPDGLVLKHSFDRTKGAEPGELNSDIVTGARFINMHHANGVAIENIHVAIVVHGTAIYDVTTHEFYNAHKGGDNANAGLIKALVDAGARVIVCGQSAASRDVTKADLLAGVEMALSATTAHALLQMDGYTLNPF